MKRGEESINDYVTCQYCGIVRRGHRCPNKPKRNYAKDSKADKFRQTAVWKKKAEQIKRRDRFLCRACEAGLYHTVTPLNFTNLEAHHITSIAEDYNQRLDDGNIITLCQFHHKAAERGDIPKEDLYKLIEELPDY